MAWAFARGQWATSLATAAGVAVAAAVITGSLIVGDSVRGSLRDLALDRGAGRVAWRDRVAWVARPLALARKAVETSA